MNRVEPKIAIVIPVYKKLSANSKNESALLEQTKEVFKERALFLAGPDCLSTNLGADERFDFISFDNEFFKDKFTYSRLLCSLQFYQSFSDYDFIQVVRRIAGFLRIKLIILPPKASITLARLG